MGRLSRRESHHRGSGATDRGGGEIFEETAGECRGHWSCRRFDPGVALDTDGQSGLYPYSSGSLQRPEGGIRPQIVKAGPTIGDH
jgi:hypothetical protein